MEKDVNIAIMGTITSKVVIGFVGDWDVLEGEVGDEVIQNVDPLLVVVVHISISPYEENGIRICLNKFFNAYLKLGHFSNKLNIFAMCREVNTDMDGDRIVGELKDDRGKAWSCNWVNSYEWVKCPVPEAECTTYRLVRDKDKVWIVDISGVKDVAEVTAQVIHESPPGKLLVRLRKQAVFLHPP